MLKSIIWLKINSHSRYGVFSLVSFKIASWKEHRKIKMNSMVEARDFPVNYWYFIQRKRKFGYRCNGIRFIKSTGVLKLNPKIMWKLSNWVQKVHHPEFGWSFSCSIAPTRSESLHFHCKHNELKKAVQKYYSHSN